MPVGADCGGEALRRIARLPRPALGPGQGGTARPGIGGAVGLPLTARARRSDAATAPDLGDNGAMHAVLAGLTTRDEVHLLDHVPDPLAKATSLARLACAGGPATNAAVALAMLCALDEDGSGAPAGAPARVGGEPAPGRGSRGWDPRASTVSLLTALGPSDTGSELFRELTELGVTVLDVARPDLENAEPAHSVIVEHPAGRMVASTNATVEADRGMVEDAVQDDAEAGPLDVVLVDGHHPDLADVALGLGTGRGLDRAPLMAGRGTLRGRPEEAAVGAAARDGAGDPDPFSELEDKPSHLRILDGGSWKPGFAPLLGFVDVAVISADFRPPLLMDPERGRRDDPATRGALVPVEVQDAIAAFLRGFGITKVVRTDGARPVRWWWDGATGEVPVDAADPARAGETRGRGALPFASTLGAGDVFHGAFAWALGARHAAGLAVPADPTEVIRFASAVAGLSTRTFGTREWRHDPALPALVSGERARVESERVRVESERARVETAPASPEADRP